MLRTKKRKKTAPAEVRELASADVAAAIEAPTLATSTFIAQAPAMKQPSKQAYVSILH